MAVAPGVRRRTFQVLRQLKQQETFVRTSVLGLAAAALAMSLAAVPAVANIRITEVAPWSSGGNSPVNADWFELTNTGPSAVSVAGWKMDDSSNAFGSSVALRGVTSIAAGESVIFIESDALGSNDAVRQAAFVNNWFGGSSSVQLGFYGGSGVGLGTGGDGVTIFDAAGVSQASVSFGASPSAAPFATFDNAAGLNGVAISNLSAVGVNGAFLTASGAEIGSPGAIAPIPEPGTYAMLAAGLVLLGVASRRRS
jgi:hypothetical protein